MTAPAATSVQVDASGLHRRGPQAEGERGSLRHRVAPRRRPRSARPACRTRGVFDRLQRPGGAALRGGGRGRRAARRRARERDARSTSLVEYLAEAAGCVQGLDTEREHEFLERLEQAVRSPPAHLRRGLAAGVSGTGDDAHDGDAGVAPRLPRPRRRQPGLSISARAGSSSSPGTRRPASTWSMPAPGPRSRRARRPPRSALVERARRRRADAGRGAGRPRAGRCAAALHRGLTRHVPDERIAEVLGRTADAATACRGAGGRCARAAVGVTTSRWWWRVCKAEPEHDAPHSTRPEIEGEFEGPIPRGGIGPSMVVQLTRAPPRTALWRRALHPAARHGARGRTPRESGLPPVRRFPRSNRLDLRRRPVPIVLPLDHQRWTPDSRQVPFDVPGSEARLQPHVGPAIERRVHIGVPRPELVAQAAGLEGHTGPGRCPESSRPPRRHGAPRARGRERATARPPRGSARSRHRRCDRSAPGSQSERSASTAGKAVRASCSR